ncbi:MAG: YabP/YqfC family sporulation protein [Clostridia bacterium]|nr:YabP/YqfC family sporulation protein [Clostridia bacterium]
MRLFDRSRRARGGRFPKPERHSPRVAPALEWAEDVSGRCARTTAIGNKRLLVENHRGILAFSDDLVRLATAGGDLCVTGRHLTLQDVRQGALIIHGSIRRLELPCAGGDGPDEG